MYFGGSSVVTANVCGAQGENGRPLSLLSLLRECQRFATLQARQQPVALPEEIHGLDVEKVFWVAPITNYAASTDAC